MGQIWSYVLCYLFWIVSVGLGLLDMILIRELLGQFSDLLVADIWICVVVDKFALLILGLIWIAFTIVSENHYRKGISEGDLVRRFALVTAAELSVPVLAYVMPFLIP